MKIRKIDFLNILIIGAIIAILLYIIARLFIFLFTGYTFLEKFFSLVLMFGEFFILIHALGYALNLFRVLVRPKDKKDLRDESLKRDSGELPGVAILVAARHEPKEVLADTFRALNGLNYRNKSVYFLDDSSDEKYIQEADELVRAYHLNLFRRKVRHGAKAGIINDCLRNLTQKYIAIFDADQNPLPEFLNVLIPIMEKDEKLSFVQTPQFYSNINESRVVRGAAFQQSVFYEYICEGKSSRDAMFCCGTNIVFRRDALVAVGGLDESTVTEDFATSVKLHAGGWSSLYYNHVSAFGMGPENLLGYFKQQFRWATGTIAVFKKLIVRLLIKPFSLKFIQWWEYLLSSSYYLIGIAFFALMICPVVYLLFKIPAFFIKPEIYFWAFVPYITLSVSVFYMVMSVRNYKFKDLFLGQLLGIAAFSVYIRGAVSALLGVKVTFGITGKAKGRALSYLKLWPQLSMIFVNFIAFVWGINRFVYEREPAIIVNDFWVFYHTLALCGIFYFNEEDTSGRIFKRLPGGIKADYRVIAEAGEKKGVESEIWKYAFTLFLPERLEANTRLMCKLHLENSDWIIFEAIVLWSSERRQGGNFRTNLGVTAITDKDKQKIEEVLAL